MRQRGPQMGEGVVVVRVLGLGLVVAAMVGCAARQSSLDGWNSRPHHFRPSSAYRIDPSDQIRIVAPGIPEIHDGRHTVGSDGTIGLELVGRVMAAGKTPTELAQEIEQKFNRYYHDPLVGVEVTAFNSKHWYITTDSTTTAVPYTDHDTLLDSLRHSAGARPEKLVLYRRGAHGRLLPHMTINPTEMAQGRAPPPMMRIEEGDVVYISYRGRLAWPGTTG